MGSAHITQCRRRGALINGAGTCTSANAGGSSFDTVCPTISGSTMGNGQAGDLELDAVDGCGCHGVESLGCIVADLEEGG